MGRPIAVVGVSSCDDVGEVLGRGPAHCCRRGVRL